MFAATTQLSALEKAYDTFHRDNPGVGYFLVSEGEGQEGGAIYVHLLKEFSALHSQGRKVTFEQIQILHQDTDHFQQHCVKV